MRYALPLLIVFAAGCTKDADPVGLNEPLPPKGELTRGTVTLGMSKAQVVARFGEPDQKKSLNPRDGETWFYGRHDIHIVDGEVIFFDGKPALPQGGYKSDPVP